MSCGSITVGSIADCTALPKGGTKPRAVVINYDDIASVTYSGSKVTAITLNAGAAAYAFTGFRNDIKKTDEVINPGVGINEFKHTAGWVIYERTQDQKDNVEKLAKGRFVTILENKGKDNDAFEVLGLGVGLEIVPGAIRNAHENGGFFVLSFATPDGEQEAKLPQTFFDTDYATTLAAVDALLATS